MAEVPLDLLLRQQERVLDELRSMRTDIRDFRADIEPVREVGEPYQGFGSWYRARRRCPMWTTEQRQRHDRAGLRYPSDLSDGEWALVEPLSRRPGAAAAGAPWTCARC